MIHYFEFYILFQKKIFEIEVVRGFNFILFTVHNPFVFVFVCEVEAYKNPNMRNKIRFISLFCFLFFTIQALTLQF